MDNRQSSVNDHERDLKSRIIEIPLDTVWLSVSPQFKVQPFNKNL